MMQAIERASTSLRCAITYWLHRSGLRHDPQVAAGTRLAHELGLSSVAVARILDQTAADLRKLDAMETEGVDARPIIERAVKELGKLSQHARPYEEEAMDRYLQQLSDRDYQILRYFKEGKKHEEIAALMGSNEDLVRRSLVTTYAELRISMITAHRRAMAAQAGGLGMKHTSLPR